MSAPINNNIPTSEPRDLLSLVVIILLLVILLIGILSNYFVFNCCQEYLVVDDDDDNPGLAALNRVYRKEDDIEYQAHINDDHNTWETSSHPPQLSSLSSSISTEQPLLEGGATPSSGNNDVVGVTARAYTKQSSSVTDKRELLKSKSSIRQGPTFLRSKSYSLRQKRVRTFWDDRLSKLNTPQVLYPYLLLYIFIHF